MATGFFKRIILGTGLTGTDNGDDTITIDGAIPGVTSLAAAGDTPMTGALDVAAGAGIAVTQDDVDTLTITNTGGGGTPAFVGCKVRRTTVQTIANNTATAISFNAEDYDSSAFHDNSTDPTRITIPTGKGGKYLLIGGGFWNASPGTSNRIQFRIGGTTIITSPGSLGPAAAGYPAALAAMAELSAGSYVEMMVVQVSGGDVDFGSSTQNSQAHFSATLLGV